MRSPDRLLVFTLEHFDQGGTYRTWAQGDPDELKQMQRDAKAAERVDEIRLLMEGAPDGMTVNDLGLRLDVSRQTAQRRMAEFLQAANGSVNVTMQGKAKLYRLN